jgi:ketosteroid isomerase-like protein
MPHRKAVRCPHCGRTTRIDLVWATHDVCPHCLRSLSGGAAEPGGSPSESERTLDPSAAVTAWIEAFNRRDLEAMLALMSPWVDFHPLRWAGIEREYRGHDGVRRWFDQLRELGYEHRLRLDEVREASGDQTVAIGVVDFPDGPRAPFWALARIPSGLMVGAYLYLTEPDIMDLVRA